VKEYFLQCVPVVKTTSSNRFVLEIIPRSSLGVFALKSTVFDHSHSEDYI